MNDRPERILIVDDTPANLEIMVEYLAESGFRAMVARTGEIGLQIARRERPDLILLDVMLPGMDGFEVCRCLKADEQTREIPVIFMTVVMNVEGKVMGFQAGGVDYITKPFQLEEVLARVNTHLTLHRLQQDLRELNRTLEDKVTARTAELAKANRAYKALSDCNQALLRAAEESELLRDICRIIQRECGYRLVWIGLADQDEARTVRPVAQVGYEEGYLQTVTISWADNAWGRGPTGTAIRTGKPAVNREALTNPAYAPWRAEALKRGYASSAAIPLAAGGRVLGALNVYAAEPEAFAPEEVALLAEIANDLAYGLRSLRLQSAHKHLEAALKESEEFHRVTMENIVDPVFITDDDGNFTFICGNVAHLLRYTCADVQRMGNITRLVGDLPFRHEDLHAQDTLRNIERVVTDHDGHAHTFLITVKQVSIKGGTILWLWHDITERKQTEEALRASEARYRQLFEDSSISQWEEDFSGVKTYLDALQHSGVKDVGAYFDQHPEAVAECAGLVKVLDVNHATLALLHAQNKEALRAGLSQVFTVESLDVFREELLALGAGHAHFVSETIHKTLTGERRTVILQLTVVPGYEHTLARVLISLQDISERKRVEEELRKHREHLEEIVAERTEALEQEIIERTHIERALQEAKDAAEAARQAAETANQAKSIFLANMSHELRTPLNAILGFTQLLQREADLPPARQEKLDTILRSGEHLLKLINDVLDLSKIEAGRMTLHPMPVDLWHLLATVEDMLRERAEQKGLQFAIIRAPGVPRHIQADETKLRQVLVNLLGNAIKFTEQGRIILRILDLGFEILDFAPPQSQISNLKFEISDTGRGIAPEDLDAIFQPFTQSEHGLQPREGTGLGLTISRAFVRLMGGELRAVSTVGAGSCFTFEIPVELAEAFTLHPTGAPGRVIGLAPGQPAYRLLVVDDDADNRTFLTELLRSVGFDVREAANGVEAFAQYVSFHPHLIWMDIQLPIMNGCDTTELIRECQGRPASLYPATVIIALTGHVFEAERAQILAAGCDDVLRKPIKEADIFEALRRHLGVALLSADGDNAMAAPSAGLRLTPAALATLPADRLHALEQAVINGNRHAIAQILDELRPQYAPVADMVARLVKEFAYKDIWHMIQQLHTHSANPEEPAHD